MSTPTMHQPHYDATLRSPTVGIFWGVQTNEAHLMLPSDRTCLGNAEPYGTVLTHPRGHLEVWEGWRRLGPAGLARRNLPSVIIWHEYEYFPRGRVVFDTCTKRFTLYADRRLQTSSTLSAIIDLFDLIGEPCDVREDPHYRLTPGL